MHRAYRQTKWPCRLNRGTQYQAFDMFWSENFDRTGQQFAPRVTARRLRLEKKEERRLEVAYLYNALTR